MDSPTRDVQDYTTIDFAGLPLKEPGDAVMHSRVVVMLLALVFAAPAEARFLQADPAGVEGGVHLYAYVGNDPLNFIDPHGLDCAGAGGTTSCTTAAYSVSFPTPKGWQDFTSSSSNYHSTAHRRAQVC